jgi:glycosyltransferase involved in cell wall biosynthesis
VLFKGPAPSLQGYENAKLNFAPLTAVNSLENWDIAILGSGFLVHEASLISLPARFIVVSHHPHDGNLEQLLMNKKPHAVVSLGRYQYLSNSSRGVNHFRIPSFYLGGERLQKNDGTKDPKLIGHISSLHPSKGFHVIAKKWRKVVRKNSGVKLEVLGGASLYGQHENHPLLPTTQAYGDRLTRLLGSDLQNGTVQFLGRVPGSIDSIVKRWSVAVINPSGIGEADPATLRDLIRLGVPVVSSRKYGLSEYMDYFPETTVKNARSIPSTVNRLLDSHELQLKLIDRSRDLAASLLARNKVIENAWDELLFLKGSELLAREGLNLASLQPEPPELSERLTLFRNDLHARAYRFLEGIYTKTKSVFIKP